MSSSAFSAFNGVPIPPQWHLAGAQVRHLCGSAATVKLASAEPAEPEVEPSQEVLTAPIEIFVETHKARQDRELIYRAIQHAGKATRAEIVAATGLYLQRVIDLTREDEERGVLLRLARESGRPVLLAMSGSGR